MTMTNNTTQTATNNPKTPVTVLGLGSMGQALAAAFLRAGHPTTVWNRSAGKGEQLIAQGAVRAATAAEAVRASELIVVCLVDYDASGAVLAPLAAEFEDRVLVNLTSDTPERAREAAAWAAEHEIAYLDGAIMVPTPVIGSPEALFFYAGPKAAYDKHEAALKALGGNATHLGDEHALAGVYDLALLDLFWHTMSGVVHALALAGADGVKGAHLSPYLTGFLSIMPAIIEGMGTEADDGKYPGAEANLTMEVAAIDHIIHAADHRNLDTTALRAMKAVADRAIAKGHGADSWTATIEAVRPQA
ncbi:NAD(P)-binding domain-containing protein [Streptomyces sp. NBC_01304]|nr:NAD(P)-binding domain-containing protein [Streptomyces sp. NBC_01304]